MGTSVGLPTRLLAVWKLRRHSDRPRAAKVVALVARLTAPRLWRARLAQAQASTERLPRLWWGARATPDMNRVSG